MSLHAFERTTQLKNAALHFSQLTPDLILQSIEDFGLMPTGRIIQLNSYENRVYEIEIEATNSEPNKVVAKFYRPERWNEKALYEEHFFIEELNAQGIPAVCPLTSPSGKSLHTRENIHFTVFPKCYGRQVQELLPEDLYKVGGLIARMHNQGSQSDFAIRPVHDAENFGEKNLEILDPILPPEIKGRYLEAAKNCLDALDDYANPHDFIRIHGDCHKGNLLIRDVRGEPLEYFFVDFDDCMMGHPAQDLWMLMSACEEPSEQEKLIDGYCELRSFKDHWMDLFEPLRALRIISYGAWIAKRWEDQSFPKLFPQFHSYNYWAEETEALERIAWEV